MLKVVPITLRQANELVSKWHRHHKPSVGHRWSIGVSNGTQLVGAAIVGRPVARMTPQYSVAEVARLVTDGTPNACSILYAASARAAKAMGFDSIQTFILDNEPGTSLRAAGWTEEDHRRKTGLGDWGTRERRRSDQPKCRKRRFFKLLNC